MTSPKYAQNTNDWGRLYRRPDCPVPAGMSIRDAVLSGYLFPSVTTVIDVLSKPFLQTWAGRLAAETAYEMATIYPERVAANPKGAVNYAKLASERHRDAAASLGDRVHDALEDLANGVEIHPAADIIPFIDSWRKFVNDWEPEWIALEMTMYGTVDSPYGPLGYAGTADGIARLKDGTPVILDYKSGKNVHSEAAIQLAALAHAKEGINADGLIVPAPYVESGIVVHVTAKGYKVHPVGDLDGKPWRAFQSLRDTWEWSVHESLHGKDHGLMNSVRPGTPLPKRSGNRAD